MLFIGQAGPDALQSLLQTDLILFVAWLVGDAARIRQLYAENLAERARLVEREREERTRRAVLEERERIARELHDVIAHHVSVMVIQAGGGLSAIATRPGDARSALESIATTGRLALTDMRRMLGVLGEAETQEPMPGLDRLDDLVAQVRLAGLPVELSVEGERRRLDPGLELSAYRIVQEALTNSLKHAQGGRAQVVVTLRARPSRHLDRRRARIRAAACRGTRPRGPRPGRDARACRDAARDARRPADDGGLSRGGQSADRAAPAP